MDRDHFMDEFFEQVKNSPWPPANSFLLPVLLPLPPPHSLLLQPLGLLPTPLGLARFPEP